MMGYHISSLIFLIFKLTASRLSFSLCTFCFLTLPVMVTHTRIDVMISVMLTCYGVTYAGVSV